MSGTAWIVVALAAVAAGAVGLTLGRRSLRVSFRELEERAQVSDDALVRREQSSREDRQVQDLILASMQEGVLLFDGTWGLAFANDALDGHPPPGKPGGPGTGSAPTS